MFDVLYTIRDDDKSVFGNNFCGPEKLEHAKDILIAKYPKTCGDGQPVEVYCCALPARFYTVKAQAEPNSIGEMQPAFEVRTGSGGDKLAATVAEAIASAMLGFYAAGYDDHQAGYDKKYF